MSNLLNNRFMGGAPSLPCCTERSKYARQSPPSRVMMSSKMTSIVKKLGAADNEFSETVMQLNSGASLPLGFRLELKQSWAVPPSSVAAQGALNLAARLRDSKDIATLRDQYYRAACLSPLVNNLLATKELDKVHAALIALSAITENCQNQEILDELVQLDSLKILVRIAQSTPAGEGARMTAAGVLRNIIGKTKRSYKTEFVRSGGITALLKLLEFDPSRVTDDQYTQWILDRVNDMRDYLEDPSGKVDEVIAKLLVAENVRSKLERLSDSKDNDIIEGSLDILNLLAKY